MRFAAAHRPGGLRAGEALVLGLAIAAFFVLVATRAEPRGHADAQAYFYVAEAMRSGTLLDAPSTRIPGLANRTPGYPLLLATAQSLTPDEGSAVYALHLAIGLATLVYVSLVLRRICPLWICAGMVLFVQWRMREYFPLAITEWTTFNGMLVLLASLPRAVDAPSRHGMMGVGLLCAFLVLTRPALAVVGAVPAGAALVQAKLPRWKALVVALAPLALLLPWMAINQARLGSFTLTPFTGTSLVGIGATIGHAEPLPGDGPELRALIEELNARKRPPPGDEIDPTWLGEDTFAHVYTWNVWQVAEGIRRAHDWDLVTFDRLAMTYGQRSIRENFAAYLRYVGLQLGGALRRAAPLVPLVLIVPIVWLVRRRHRGLALASVAVLLVHAGNVLLCAVVAVLLPRYEAVTYEPLVFAACLVAAVVALDVLSGRGASGEEHPGGGERDSLPAAENVRGREGR